jgi:hypothetical protein
MAHRPSPLLLCGDIGSGKDTVAELLAEEYDYAIIPWAFALKDTLARLLEPLGVDPRHFFGSQAEKNEPITQLPPREFFNGEPIYWTGRSVTEWFGTEVGRKLHPDLWVAQVMKSATGGSPVVIPDGRFPNEFAAVKAAGGEAWRMRLLVGHMSPSCPAETDWRLPCACGVIESTGHISDMAWRDQDITHVIAAPKPGVEIIQARVRERMASPLYKHARHFVDPAVLGMEVKGTLTVRDKDGNVKPPEED